MRKDLSILLIIVLVALAIRLYPTAISAMPYSTDAWPLIRNTDLILQNTPTPLNSGIFDTYNNFWAASQLYSATLSQITGLEPITAMSWGIPIAAALAIPLFYLLAKKITANKEISLIATLLLAVAFPYTFFTAGVTKEAFATPIYISLILLFLFKHDKKTTFLFLLASLALAFTHHLTAFFATVTLIAISIAFAFSKNKNEEFNSTTSNLLFAAIQVIITLLYLIFFASPTFSSNLTASTILTVGIYQILAVALSAWLVLSAKKGLKRNLPKLTLYLFVLTAFMLTIINTSTLPDAHLIYAFILILGLPAAAFGLYQLYQRSTRMAIPLFWMLSIVGFICFSLFANVAGAATFTWRSINFLLPPLLILVAAGTYSLITSPKGPKVRKLTKAVSAILIIAIVAVNVSAMYQTVSAQNPALGYSWLYTQPEFNSADWISSNSANQTVAGDIKVEYLLGQYFNETVSVSAGLRYLQGDGSAPEILYIYNQMGEPGKGYVIEGVPYTLPVDWMDKLSNYNLVYANSEVTIYAKQ